MAKSAWMAHLAKFRKAHPEIHSKNMFGEAAKAYKKQAGGSALGGDLSPTDFKADPKFPTSGGAALQVEATQYSGGKKSRKARSGKKSRKSGKKSRRCKRR
jgi:hypothetical protein